MVDVMRYLLYPMIIMQRIKQFFSTYPINTEDLSIHAIGVQEGMSPVIVDRPGGTGDWLFMFFYENKTIVNQSEQPENTMIIWDPQHGHYYGHQDNPWRHSWLHCDGNCIAHILAQCAIPTNEPFHTSGPEIFERYLIDIYREVTFFSTPEPHIVQNLLQNLAYEIARDIRGGNEGFVIPHEFLAVKQHISEHFNESMSLSSLAEMTNLSVPHFCCLFKRFFKQPPIEMLIDSRMSHAVYLLRDVSLSITEVAHRVGYSDIYQFSKLFKNRYSESPRRTRERLTRRNK